MSDAQTTLALIKRLEQYELRLLMGDQHDRKMADDIGRAAHFLALAAPQPVTNAQAVPDPAISERDRIAKRAADFIYENDPFGDVFCRYDLSVLEQPEDRLLLMREAFRAGQNASALPSTTLGGVAREKEITRLATIEECARLAENTGLRNPENIARDIRALALTSTSRDTP